MPILLDPLSRFVPVFMEGEGAGGAGGSGGEGSGGTGGGAGSAGEGGNKPAGTVFSADYVKALRDENAQHRTYGKGLEKAVKAGLGLKEDDPLPADIAASIAGLKTAGSAESEAVKTQAKGALLKAAFLTVAAGKVADADDAYLLAGSLLAGIEVDLATGALTIPKKDGKDRTLADIVTDLLTAKPHLKAGGTGAGVGGTATGGGSGNQKPTPKEQAAEIAKNRTQNTAAPDPWASK